MSMPSTTPSHRPIHASHRPRIATALMLLAAFVAMGGRAARVDAAQGDLNCDGVVSLLDVPPFVLGLIDPAAYAVAFPACDVTRADVDGNAENDGRDIKAFVSLLLSPPPQEIVLRDSIGTSSASTDGNISFSSWHNLGGSNVKVTAEVSAPQDLTLKSVRVIGSKATTALTFAGIDYAIRVWSSVNAALAQPLNGDIANIVFDNPSVGPTVWGLTGNMPGIGVVTSYEFKFDLSPYGVSIPAGATRLIGLHFVTNGCATGAGCLGVLESTDTGISDRQMGPTMPGGWVWIGDSTYSIHDGRAAWDIRALAN